MSLHDIFEETKKNFMNKKRANLQALREAEYAETLREAEAAQTAKLKELFDLAFKEVLAVDFEKLNIAQQELVLTMMEALEPTSLTMDKKDIPVLQDIIAKCQKLPHMTNKNPNA